jgi:ribosomal-protein-alanine N-acetyltransferase
MAAIFCPHCASETDEGAHEATRDKEQVQMASENIATSPETVTLVGPRTTLRPVDREDREAFLEMAGESRGFHSPWTSAPGTDEEFQRYLDRSGSDRFVGLVLLESSSRHLVGVFNLSEIVRGPFQNAYLGFYVHARYAGQGLMSEGLRLTLRYAFGVLKLHRLEANIQPDNARSVRLVERCGFVREGFSPKYLMIGGMA